MMHNFTCENKPKITLKTVEEAEEAYDKYYLANNFNFTCENKYKINILPEIMEKMNKSNKIDREIEVESFSYNEDKSISFICPVIVSKNRLYSTPLYPFIFEDSYLEILKAYIK
jgi:hypothetical protein